MTSLTKSFALVAKEVGVDSSSRREGCGEPTTTYRERRT